MDARAQANRKLVRRLALVAVGMFGFGFAMWPLYTVFCEVTGFGGRGIKTGAQATATVATDRKVKVRFDANVNSGLPWHFQPAQNTMDVAVGEPSEALYLAMNPTPQDMVGHATYNVTPPEASLYFVKTECFCFTQQALKASETREMPVYFYVQADLPAHINEITLSYTFYRDANASVAMASDRDN